MALSQLQAGVQVQLSDLEKSVIGGAVKEAQDFLAKHDNEDAQLRQLATVATTVTNAQSQPIKLERSHEWFGRYLRQPPPTIGENGIQPGVFVHRAGPPSIVGSKAAVIYGTYGKALPQLGYLLAWYKSEHTPEHKVHVEAGELSKLVEQEWCEIERKLDASHSKSRSVDKATGATAAAEITIQDGNLAFVGAYFHRVTGDSQA